MIYAIARSVLSQTQPTRTLRAAASSSAVGAPHLPHWVSLANALDDEVLRRPVPKLVAGDDDQVRQLLRAFCDDREHEMWTKAAAHDTSAAAVRCNMVAHFFCARFYDGEAVQLRAHLINDASEDNAHSHSASFFSHCLSGGYSHEIWEKEPASMDGGSEEQFEEQLEPCFYETKRRTSSLNGSTFNDSVRRPGRFLLSRPRSHEHRRNDLYYCEATDVYHKVCVRSEHLRQGGEPNITLVVRGKQATFAGSHFVTVGAPLSEEVRHRSVRDFDDERGARSERQRLGLVRQQMSIASQSSSAGTDGSACAAGDDMFSGRFRVFA